MAKKNKLTTSKKPLDALVPLAPETASEVNGGAFTGPGGKPIFGLLVNPHPKHPKHPKKPIFGLMVHP